MVFFLFLFDEIPLFTVQLFVQCTFSFNHAADVVVVFTGIFKFDLIAIAID